LTQPYEQSYRAMCHETLLILSLHTLAYQHGFHLPWTHARTPLPSFYRSTWREIHGTAE